MTGKVELCSTMDTSYKSKIKLGDDNYLQVEGKRAMEMHTNEGKKKFNDTNHGIKYKFIFQDNKYVMYDKNHGHRFVTTIPMTKNRLFSLKFGEKRTNFLNIAIDDKIWLSYLKCGHLNFPSLRLLVS